AAERLGCQALHEGFLRMKKPLRKRPRHRVAADPIEYVRCGEVITRLFLGEGIAEGCQGKGRLLMLDVYHLSSAELRFNSPFSQNLVQCYMSSDPIIFFITRLNQGISRQDSYDWFVISEGFTQPLRGRACPRAQVRQAVSANNSDRSEDNLFSGVTSQ